MKPVKARPRPIPAPLLNAQHMVCIPGENQPAFEALCTQLLADLKPKDFCQTQLVGRLATLTWRLARLYRIEANLYVLALHEVIRAGAPLQHESVLIAQAYQYLAEHPQALTLVHKQQQQLQKAWDETLKQLRVAQAPTPAVSASPSRDQSSRNRRLNLWFRHGRPTRSNSTSPLPPQDKTNPPRNQN